MYNLLVSASENDWDGDPFIVARSRCVSANEYTAPEIAERFSDLNASQIRELCSLPCMFAYESGCGKDPKFGALRGIRPRTGDRLQIEYRLIACDPFATVADLKSLATLLDIGRWEMNRTHWAVKDVDLAVELNRRGIVLPDCASGTEPMVDIRRHWFEVALSFPGEHRGYVEEVAEELTKELGADACFYDQYYESQLGQPGLDVLLQGIYGERSGLVVAFVCREYDEKDWCGIEWQKIKERRVGGDEREIMYVRVDEGEVAGMTNLDGYVDARARAPQELARLVVERVRIAKQARREG